MPQQAQLSRADLLRCIYKHGDAELDRFAHVVGFEPRPPTVSVPLGRSSVPFISVHEQPFDIVAAERPIVQPKAHFYRVVKRRQLKPEEVIREEPDWFKTAKPYWHESEIAAEPDIMPPPRFPLMAWARLWPFLKLALGTVQTTRDLDMPRVVAKVARGERLDHLAYKQHRAWSAESQILLDYAKPLTPFWDDFNNAVASIADLRGEHGLTLLALPEGNPGGPYWRKGGRDWQAREYYPKPAPGSCVLILSDLGCIDKDDSRRQQWRRWGRRLRSWGCRPVVLMPCPRRWWDAELARLFVLVCWDRAVRIPAGLVYRSALPEVGNRADDKGAKELLVLIAAAIWVEPDLLRAARFLLPARCDVGSEAAAWNHADVIPTPLAFSYDTECITAYRDEFRNNVDAARQRMVGELINRHHAHLSPSIAFEEQGNLADLVADISLAAETDQFRQRFAKTLDSQTEPLYAASQSLLP